MVEDGVDFHLVNKMGVDFHLVNNIGVDFKLAMNSRVEFYTEAPFHYEEAKLLT